MFFLESGIKILRDFFGIDSKCTLNPLLNIHDCRQFVQIKRQVVYFREKEIRSPGLVIFNRNQFSLLHCFYRSHP